MSIFFWSININKKSKNFLSDLICHPFYLHHSSSSQKKKKKAKKENSKDVGYLQEESSF